MDLKLKGEERWSPVQAQVCVNIVLVIYQGANYEFEARFER